jgi:hypothetical protein
MASFDSESMNRKMIPIDRNTRGLVCLTALLVCACFGPAAFGQDGEEIVDDGPIVPQVVMPVQVARAVQFNPEQVDQWIFSRWGGAAGAKARLEANLALRIDDIERACAVTELQKKKLKLAGMGDIKRYYDRVEDLKRKYAAGAGSPQINNNIWQEMQPLQLELNGGLLGDASIFVKTIKSTLGPDQAKRYDELMRGRTDERRRATIEWFVVHIDKALGLSDLQRGRLVELLASETPPPERFGQADFWYLMYQMTRLPEAKVKDILDEPQWRLLSRQFIQARGMGPWLRSNGLIAQTTDVEPTIARPPAAKVFLRNFVAPVIPDQADRLIRKK